MGWISRFVRRHTRPIHEDRATFWRNRLTFLYIVLAWNALGIIAYQAYNGKSDWAKHHGLPQQTGSPAQQWAYTLGIKQATVYRVSGLTVVDKYEIDENKQNNVERIEDKIE